MERKYFNFNNEVDSFDIQMDAETGRVLVPGPNGGAEYDSVQQLAEIYATARDVKPENLKNWTLVENGDVYSFVLKAGTAGNGETSAQAVAVPVIPAADIQDDVQAVIGALRQEGAFHPLDINRVAQELDGCGDVLRVLTMSAVPDVARAVYDRLDARGALQAEEPELEEVDTRSEMEKYLDSVLETDKSLAFFAALMNLGRDAEKEDVLHALEQSSVPYTPAMLGTLYEDAIGGALRDGIHVQNRTDAILVISQAVPGIPSEDVKAKMGAAASMAGRTRLNVEKYTVGHRHIRKSADMVDLDKLGSVELYMLGTHPAIVEFNEAVDAELEEEQRQAEEEAAGRRSTASGSEDGDFEDGEDDYNEDDYDEDDYDDEEEGYF